MEVKPTWYDVIIHYAQQTGRKGFTAGEFARDTMCVKLTTRISEMEQAGYKFFRQWETNETTGSRYLRFWLLKSPKIKKKKKK